MMPGRAAGVPEDTPLRLSVATGPYDRIVPLRTGEVRADGLELDCHTELPVHGIFVRMAESAAYDVAEMSLALCLTMKSRGEFPFAAIPVFPSRVFRHGGIYVNADAGIREPRDLAGRRVGIQEYRQTALVWVRGILRDRYGVDTAEITWVEGGVNAPRRTSSATDARPAGGARIEPLAGHDSLSEALAAGALDAVIAARRPDSFATGAVRRLFPDYRAEERTYFQETGIFPIMHTVVIREALYNQHPWIAERLYQAFDRAKGLTAERLRYSGALTAMVPWLHAELADADALFGGDAWPYGLAANRGQLETFLRYLAEDGLIEAPPPVDSLFVPVGETA